MKMVRNLFGSILLGIVLMGASVEAYHKKDTNRSAASVEPHTIDAYGTSKINTHGAGKAAVKSKKGMCNDNRRCKKTSKKQTGTRKKQTKKY